MARGRRDLCGRGVHCPGRVGKRPLRGKASEVALGAPCRGTVHDTATAIRRTIREEMKSPSGEGSTPEPVLLLGCLRRPGQVGTSDRSALAGAPGLRADGAPRPVRSLPGRRLGDRALSGSETIAMKSDVATHLFTSVAATTLARSRTGAASARADLIAKRLALAAAPTLGNRLSSPIPIDGRPRAVTSKTIVPTVTRHHLLDRAVVASGASCGRRRPEVER